MSIPRTLLEHIRVQDVMHTGILTTDPTTPLRVVARLMSDQQIHAVAVADPDDTRRPYGFVTDLDVAAAAAAEAEITAGQAAAREEARHEVITISAAEPLSWAARLMVEHSLTHLIVVEPDSGHTSGVISTLDVARAYAGC